MENKIFMNKISKSKTGSALLIALVVMGILMTLSLGVSSLLIGTLRDSRLFLEKTRAWYAAESAMEQALLAISENQPGFETEKRETLDSANTEYFYKIVATAKTIPSKESYEIQSDEDRYAALRLNESVTIPLFRGAVPEDQAKKFRADYYLEPKLQLQGAFIDTDMDILRWKIFGIAADGKMEIINEFLPANQGNSASSPTCLGTDGSACYAHAKFYKRRLAPDGATEFFIENAYPIETFLNEHTQNFLVLTNVVNTDLIAGSLSTAEKQRVANIRYRVTEGENQPRLTLPSIKISTDGFSGETKQSLDLEVKRETFLPVFNYALYRTAE